MHNEYGYIFADPIHIRKNVLCDFRIDHYLFLYRNGPFEIKVKVRSDVRYEFDMDAVIRIIAKKYDELMLDDCGVEVASRDMRSE